MNLKFKIYFMIIFVIFIYYSKSIRIEKFTKNNSNLNLLKINYLKYVIPINKLKAKKILILGDKNLFGTFMLLKFEFINNIIVVNDILKNTINNPKVLLINSNPYEFLEKNNEYFDVIINDLNNNISKDKYYLNFFKNCINKCKYYINSVIYNRPPSNRTVKCQTLHSSHSLFLEEKYHY